MKPYEQLTRLGRLRRLRRVAEAALAGYDVDVVDLRFFAEESNLHYAVRDRAGRRYMLRLYNRRESRLADNEAELFWLRALAAADGLYAVRPLPRRDGGWVTTVAVDGVPGPQRLALFDWVPGRQLVNFLTPANYHRLGVTAARLHVQAAGMNPLPAGITTRRWDTVFYFPDEPVVYNRPEYAHLFPPARVALLDQVIARANRLLVRLYENADGLRLLHGDLHYWNVHLHRGRLYLLDFGDIILGYPLQDIAITLYYGRELPQYPALRAAFEAGYRTLLPWPVVDEADLRLLLAARMANFINYVALHYEDAAGFVESRCRQLGALVDDNPGV